MRTAGSTFSKAGPVSDSPVLRNSSRVWTLFFVGSGSVVVAVVVVLLVAQAESISVETPSKQKAKWRVFIMV